MVKKIIDLSKIIKEGMSGPIGEVKILQEITRGYTGPLFKDPCKGWESRKIIISEHVGTHLDAPYHFIPNGKTIDEISIDRFIGEAVLIDLRKIQQNKSPISKENLIGVCSKDNIEIKKDDIVLLFSNEDAKGLTKEAVDWLINKEIKGVGINIFIEEDILEDGLKVRYAHVSFLSKEIILFEDLTNMDKITKKRIYFIGLPLKIHKGTGSPMRPIVIFEE